MTHYIGEWVDNIKGLWNKNTANQSEIESSYDSAIADEEYGYTGIPPFEGLDRETKNEIKYPSYGNFRGF